MNVTLTVYVSKIVYRTFALEVLVASFDTCYRWKHTLRRKAHWNGCECHFCKGLME